MAQQEKILVIKLSALGDFIIALGAMKAIRDHHPNAYITLLTTSPFISMARKSGYFDEIKTDSKPKFYELQKWIGLYQQLNTPRYNRVYDLQNNDRTSIYFKVMTPKPEWVGATKGASHYFDPPDRTQGSAFHGLKILLENAGLKNIQTDPMNWIDADLSNYDLQEKYALIIPGAAPSRPEKIWPKEKFAEICQKIAEKDIQPVLIGGSAEIEIADYIATKCPESLNLTAKTELLDIVALGRNAQCAVGNDTGPMHMVAPTGCPSIALFSQFSNSVRNAPNGDNVTILQKDNFDDLTTDDVWIEIEKLI